MLQAMTIFLKEGERIFKVY